jgi:hypothetical protein
VFYNGAIAACRTHGTSTVVRLLPLPFARESTTSCSRLASVRKGAKALASTLGGAAHARICAGGSRPTWCAPACSTAPNHAAGTADALLRRREPLAARERRAKLRRLAVLLAIAWCASPRRARLPFLARVCAPAALFSSPARMERRRASRAPSAPGPAHGLRRPHVHTHS